MKYTLSTDEQDVLNALSDLSEDLPFMIYLDVCDILKMDLNKLIPIFEDLVKKKMIKKIPKNYSNGREIFECFKVTRRGFVFAD